MVYTMKVMYFKAKCIKNATLIIYKLDTHIKNQKSLQIITSISPIHYTPLVAAFKLNTHLEYINLAKHKSRTPKVDRYQSSPWDKYCEIHHQSVFPSRTQLFPKIQVMGQTFFQVQNT